MLHGKALYRVLAEEKVSHTGNAKYKHLSRYFKQGKWCRATSGELMVSVLLGRGAVLYWSSFKA